MPRIEPRDEEATEAVGRLLTIGAELSGKLRRRILACGGDAVEPLLRVLRDASLLKADGPGRGYAPIHAARLLAATRDARAIKPLIEALGVEGAVDLHQAIIDEAENLGPEIIEEGLAALQASPPPSHRSRLLDLLSRTAHRDDRLFVLLLKALEEDEGAETYLENYGDVRAVEPLLRLFDTVERSAVRDFTTNARLVNIACVIDAVGENLEDERATLLEFLTLAVEKVQADPWGTHHHDAYFCPTCRGVAQRAPVPHGTVAAEEVERRVRRLAESKDELPAPHLMEAVVACGEDAVAPLLRIVEDEAMYASTALGGGWGPIRSALALAELQDLRGVRPLVQALRRLDEYGRSVVGAALAAFGQTPAVHILEELQTAQDLDHRHKLLRALSQTGARNDQVFDALVSHLRGDLSEGAVYLATYGDVRALPTLRAAVDRLRGDEATALDRALIPLWDAIVALGGTLTNEERETQMKLEEESAAPVEEAKSDPIAKPVTRAEPKVGRNDPCWCGSGQKFKKCHGG